MDSTRARAVDKEKQADVRAAGPLCNVGLAGLGNVEQQYAQRLLKATDVLTAFDSDAGSYSHSSPPAPPGQARGAGGYRDVHVRGDRTFFKRATPIFDVLGRHAIHLGPAGVGNTVKLICILTPEFNMAVMAEGCDARPERL